MIFKIVFQNIKHKPLHTALSILLLTTAVGIISLILQIQETATRHFEKSVAPVDLVLGASGSPMQLVLSAVYQMDAPTGNISYSEVQKWMRHPFVKKAVPLAYGDSYVGFSIVGTTPDYLKMYQAKFQNGKDFNNDFEVVIGSQVAKKTGLKIGQNFSGVHGLSEEGEAHAETPYTVVGILQPTQTVIDKIIVCNISSVWETHHHEHEKDHHEHAETGEHKEDEHKDEEETKELTAVLLQIKNKMAFVLWPRMVKEDNLQIASPAIEINRLFSLLGVGVETLLALALGIMVISGMSIFIALYNKLKEKKYEFALLRTLGASRYILLSLIFIESIFTVVLGFACGIIVSRILLYIIAQTDEVSFITMFGIQGMLVAELYLLGGLIVLGVLAAIIPAVKAFNISISKTLHHG